MHTTGVHFSQRFIFIQSQKKNKIIIMKLKTLLRNEFVQSKNILYLSVLLLTKGTYMTRNDSDISVTCVYIWRCCK